MSYFILSILLILSKCICILCELCVLCGELNGH
jgi:hypothetical protein